MQVGKNIAVTDHAIERIRQRMGIERKGVRSLVREAWYGGEMPSEYFLRSKLNLGNFKFTTFQYRKHKGFIFVFQKKYIEAVLVTVFLENTEYYKNKYEENTKKPSGRYSYRSVLLEMYTPKNDHLRRKNNPRARHRVRRQAGK